VLKIVKDFADMQQMKQNAGAKKNERIASLPV